VIRGLYIAATGMLADSARQDVIANNLANVTTNGFKKDVSSSTPFSQILVSNLGVPGTPQVGTMNFGTQVGGITTIDSQGALRATSNPLDVGLVGDGWITVDAQGGKRYTRDGQLQVDATGKLLAGDGSPVAGMSGRPITIDPAGGTVSIAADGTVSQAGQEKGRLRIVTLDPKTLAKEGTNLVSGTETGAAPAKVKQGYLESSNVNTVTEMVELIEVMRSFEANQKAALAQSETLGDAVTKVGAVR
jgi:flagellar basal-body rod protein FlgF